MTQHALVLDSAARNNAVTDRPVGRRPDARARTVSVLGRMGRFTRPPMGEPVEGEDQPKAKGGKRER